MATGPILGLALITGGCAMTDERPPSGLAPSSPDGGDGDGTGGGGPQIGGDLDPSTNLSDLTQEQAASFCGELGAATEEAIGDPVAFTCTLTGLLVGALAGGDVAACRETRDACEASPPDGAEEGAFTCDLEDATARQGCDVSVQEAERCLSDSIDLLAENIDAFQCDALADPDGTQTLEDPASCDGLDTRCPALFGDEV